MSFSQIQGQTPAISRLKRLLISRNLPPAFLFFGTSGIGKTATALEFAKALNCTSLKPDADPCDSCQSCLQADKGVDMDIKHVNSAYQAGLTGEDVEKQSRIKIDTIRHVVKDLEMRSMTGRWKIAIVEEAHQMMPEAQNALLKALEEPPPRTLWVLVTDQRDQLLPTVRSRCQAVSFRSLPAEIIERILSRQSIPEEEAARLIPQCEGSPGQAIELWKRRLPNPASWIGDPLAPFRLAEQLPRELHLARPLVEDHLRQMAWHLRSNSKSSWADRRIRKTYQEFEMLRRALRSNADPKLIIELGAFALQGPRT